ncbi:MAG: PA0069 family radical SAM protein [Gammaproteobacteria bacterium]|nr:PA0069 family radical SAM protein [Gammaproteobacteria bacterium]
MKKFAQNAAHAAHAVPAATHQPAKGRAALSNREGRFESLSREAEDDGWGDFDLPVAARRTTVHVDASRTVISRNESPDIPFNQSINPYRGCEHGCIYCYARPTHAYLGLSPGLDFETKLFAKPDAAQLLSDEINHADYRCETIAMGTNTDPYQPVERQMKVTRGIIEVLARHRHPLTITTKSGIIERDIDLLADMAADNLVSVYISITTLNNELARCMEPRAAAPQRRLKTVERLRAAGIPTGVLVAPVIPALNDSELETILQRAAAAGAQSAGYILLRLPGEVSALFQEWLGEQYPLKAAHVMSMVRATRGGRDNDPNFGARMRGQGEVAHLIRQRFNIAVKRLGLNRGLPKVDATRFRPARGAQTSLL